MSTASMQIVRGVRYAPLMLAMGVFRHILRQRRRRDGSWDAVSRAEMNLEISCTYVSFVFVDAQHSMLVYLMT